MSVILAWFMTTALGRFVRNVLFIAAAFGAGYIAGMIAANNDAEVASLQSQLAAARADADIAAVLHEKVQRDLVALQEEQSGLARQVADYADYVSKLENSTRTCRLASPGDIKRLRAIR